MLARKPKSIAVLSQLLATMFISASIATQSSPSIADDFDTACGSYRKAQSNQRERCEKLRLPLDRGACYKEDLRPKEDAYAACVRSFNHLGAKKTIEKSAQGRQKQQPIP